MNRKYNQLTNKDAEIWDSSWKAGLLVGFTICNIVYIFIGIILELSGIL